MCPPVSKRYVAEGLSYLYVSWLYQLQHGSQIKLCFACFKVAFLDFKRMLESEDWEDEDWDSELMDDSEVLSLVSCCDVIYLQKMKPRRAWRTPGQCWKLLLEPDEWWVVRLQDVPQMQDLHHWKLSILESSSLEQNVDLLPADSVLLKRGLTILSFSPWAMREAAEGDSASRPQSSTQGGDSSTSGPRMPGENLAAVGALALGELPHFQPLNPGSQN
ncbi:hypothetical protein R6Z07F_011072 [Ovis aries]|uniref:testis-expressed protein 19.2-like n=1 Tax=Ovis canadensis TaxID=37174 RepID=UPI0005FB225B|nr:testis-expressed protein 19.1-like isoform X3 [Ovis aries]